MMINSEIKNIIYLTCCTTTLTGRNRLEARFAKYDSDSESNNILFLTI